ncbi:LexA family transcriptional regulator [Desulfovibrio sp. X2]|uniref:LexA family transcriptional regulator n=1 Tax=Desulfovibrio sp. X2 TaxID=941449 RepID=UPI0022871606|nr:LexA family transcriptional regulator [Desulfovibrio sp. X2]
MTRTVSLKEPFFPYGAQGDANFEERLKRLMHALEVDNASELAKALGIKHQAVSAARKRRQVPLNWLMHVSEARCVSLDWLLFGQGEMRLPGEEPLAAPPTIIGLDGYAKPLGGNGDCGREAQEYGGFKPETEHEAGQLVILPRVRPRLLPGSALFEQDEVRPGIAFQHFWLAAKGDILSMAVMEMHGTHMEPLIAQRSLLLLDRSQVEIVPGNVYALAFGEEIVVKRLDRLPGKLLLLSENPSFPAREVGWPCKEVRILARVLWTGREIA